MLKNVNPGLSRRFQLENAFNFPDFSDEDLVKVAWCCAMSTSITNIFPRSSLFTILWCVSVLFALSH